VPWFLLLLGGFPIGFILQYSGLQRVRQELSTSTKQLGSCQAGEQLSQLRDTATVMLLEAVQKNYGKAGEDSKEFFDQAQLVGNPRSDHSGSGKVSAHFHGTELSVSQRRKSCG
jgi:hypothetical protein